ncbi:hypothetical protein B0I35DRAFT_412081 [Stachybotrys elegans]|uniref:Helicase ATP-binding domain-containing protein n=1 Tax=Stachybotrys elegans TaxID=80388 RepID=A0A8K0SKA1_9HYPO|nr:hypothetical protein B0I35DRAFT_412081 [Stachybotrys elegans]
MAKIQALADGGNNPLTGEAWPESHAEMLKTRRNLPVYGRFDDILTAYHSSQVLVLTRTLAPASSRKFRRYRCMMNGSGLPIACIQPRRTAAASLAAKVVDELGVKLGEEVGYQIGGDKIIDMKGKKPRGFHNTLSEYACVIIDEAHERTSELDVLLAMLKDAMKRRADLKVIIEAPGHIQDGYMVLRSARPMLSTSQKSLATFLSFFLGWLVHNYRVDMSMLALRPITISSFEKRHLAAMDSNTPQPPSRSPSPHILSMHVRPG